MAIDFAEMTSTDAVYREIGRRVLEFVAFQELIDEAIAEPVSFATAKPKVTGKKKNCNPAKSHFCQTPNGAGSCVSLKKQCKYSPDGATKQAADYIGQAKSKGKGKTKSTNQASAGTAPASTDTQPSQSDNTPTLKPQSYNPDAIPDLEPKDFAEFRSDREFLQNQDDANAAHNKAFADFDGTKNQFRIEISSAISAGFVPSDEAIADVKLTKADQARVQKNRADIAARRQRSERIQKAIDHPLMDDSEASGYKPRMSKDEADNYTRGSFTGNTAFYHGNQKWVVDDMATNGIQPDLNSAGIFGKGAYFATAREVSELYASAATTQTGQGSGLIEVRARVKNPYVMNSEDINNIGTFFPGDQSNMVDSTAINEFVRAKGHDSIYLADLGYFIAFDQRQTVVVDKEDFVPDGPRMQQIRQDWSDTANSVNIERNFTQNSASFQALAGATRSENRAFDRAPEENDDDFLGDF